ncbi:ubiquitin-protein transferase [Aureococcus anophagefferens]|nr:ubiquitin-protein transferase [Aureococcus anophagefferens]
MDETLAAHVRTLQRGDDVRAVRAAQALSDLSCASDDNDALIVAAGAIPPLVALLRNWNNEVKKWATRALVNLTSGNGYHVAAQPISIVDAGGIAPLVELLRDGSDGGKEQAARALANLAWNGDDIAPQSIVDAGGIAPLVELLRDGSDDGKKRAARALRNLSSADDAHDAMIAEAGAIEPLVELERNGSDDAKEYATDALDNLAHNDDLVRPISAARRRAPAAEPTTAAMANLAACIVCQDAARSVAFLPASTPTE